MVRRVAEATRGALVGPARRAGDGARLGRLGEDAAAAHLKGLGYTILARNATAPMGEADIVARAPDGRPVIVEVKTRARIEEGSTRSRRIAPEESVTARKRRKLLAIARFLRARNAWKTPPRIDVIAIEVTRDERGAETIATLRHFTNAVRVR